MKKIRKREYWQFVITTTHLTPPKFFKAKKAKRSRETEQKPITKGKNGWHIDHKKAVTKFDLSLIKEQKKCFRYTNLQPLWAGENIRKCNRWKKKQKEGFWKKIRGGVFYTLVTIFSLFTIFLIWEAYQGGKDFAEVAEVFS